jgi:hypothetical protein
MWKSTVYVVQRKPDVLEERHLHLMTEEWLNLACHLLLLVSCLAYSSTVTTEDRFSSKMLCCLWITGHYNPEYHTLHITAMRTSNPIKVKLSLCLSTIPWKHMQKLRYSSTDSESTRWTWVVSFKSQLLSSKESHAYPLDRGLDGPQSHSVLGGEDKNILSLSGTEPIPHSPCHSLFTILAKKYWL